MLLKNAWDATEAKVEPRVRSSHFLSYLRSVEMSAESEVGKESNSMTLSATASQATALRSAKRALRKSMAQRLASLDRQEILSQSHAVTKQVLASPTYETAKSISIYVSMEQGEIDTDELCRAALKQGKRLYVPLFASTSKPTPADPATSAKPLPSAPPPGAVTFATDMRMLRITDVRDYEGMKLNKWGIREPLETTEEGAAREDALDESTGGNGLDVILAPGVAFDNNAGRLGHGKGYYDRYLSRAEAWAQRQGKGLGPVCVALGLAQQLLPEGESVPADEDDRVLDGILTPKGTLKSPSSTSRWEEGSR